MNSSGFFLLIPRFPFGTAIHGVLDGGHRFSYCRVSAPTRSLTLLFLRRAIQFFLIAYIAK